MSRRFSFASAWNTLSRFTLLSIYLTIAYGRISKPPPSHPDRDRQLPRDLWRHSSRGFATHDTVYLMPFKSQAQRRKFAELLVKGEISNETFEEWNRETGGKKLPERVKKKRAKARKSAGKKR